MTQVATSPAMTMNGPWKLPSDWQWVPLGEACQINPRRPRIVRDDDRPTSFLPMPGVDEIDGVITNYEVRPYREVAHGFTYFEEGDVLFAKITPSMQNGKCAIAISLIDGIGFGSTEFHVIRPRADITPDWVHCYMRRLAFRLEAKEHFRGAVGQQRVPDEFIQAALIPVPASVDIQHRIVARIEALMAEVKRARELLEQMAYYVSIMMKSVLGAVIKEVDNSCSDSIAMHELISSGQIKLTGGGTPSKSNEKYWVGTIPWVSPKDMKRWYIDDTQDHISPEALVLLC
jgi:type I restriction enzyme S subunit